MHNSYQADAIFHIKRAKNEKTQKSVAHERILNFSNFEEKVLMVVQKTILLMPHHIHPCNHVTNFSFILVMEVSHFFPS